MEMNKTTHKESPSGPPPAEIVEAGHEPLDIKVGPVVKFIVGLTVLGVVSAVGLWGLLKLFESQAEKREPRVSPMMSQEQRLPPEPRLQMAPGSISEVTGTGYAKGPDYEMQSQREGEDQQLNSYGWVNQGSGTVRIPIDLAMKLIVQRLPAPPSGPQSPAGASTTEAAQPGSPAQKKPLGISLPTAASSGRVAEPRKE